MTGRMTEEKEISFLDLHKITSLHATEIEQAVQRVINSGWYLRGHETEMFEKAYAEYIGTQWCIGCGNGLDALTLIFRAYKEMGLMHDDDEVIVPANTYIASILAITRCNLKPILVEPDITTLQIDDKKIEAAITPRTRAIMIVHLYGRCAYTETIGRICKEHNLRLVEDNAQAHGCIYHGSDTEHDGKHTGSIGDAAHSFYPTKNLGALGDAGAITTNDSELARLVRALANYGSEKKYVFNYIGINSRMDEIQAAVLRIRLPYLEQENAIRQVHAQRYYSDINNPDIQLLPDLYLEQNVFHLFPIFCTRRDALRKWLAEHGIQTDVHYPIPPHKQQCYKAWSQLTLPITEHIHQCILSLPVSQVLTDDEQAHIIHAINTFK